MMGWSMLQKLTPLVRSNSSVSGASHEPWGTSETVAYLAAVLKRVGDYPLVVEVRHGSWDAPETLELMRTSGVSFCNIDQPIISRSLGPSAQTTAAVGYVRLHGRRYDRWCSDDAIIPAHERYNYLDSSEELASWVNRD